MTSNDKPCYCAFVVAGAVALVGTLLTVAAVRSKTKTIEVAAHESEKSRKVYESLESERQYMDFHFTPSKELYVGSLKSIEEAFDFPVRVATKFQQYRPEKFERALDLGCAVGASTFELSKHFGHVLGVDLSSKFVDCANRMKNEGSFTFESTDQGRITVPRTATLPAGCNPSHCTFLVGDAVEIGDTFGTFDGVLAANLVCRVAEPRSLLDSFSKMLVGGGILVLLSPYSWWDGATAPSKWIGGVPGEERSELQVKSILQVGFELLDEKNEPFLIRDHSRRYQVGFSHCTVWRRKSDGKVTARK